MTQIIEVPGMGDVEFPDDMGDDQITAAIARSQLPQGTRDRLKAQYSEKPTTSFFDGFGLTMRDQGNEWKQAVKNVGNTALKLGTGASAKVASDVAGLGTLAADIGTFGAFDLNPIGVKDRVQSALTYNPEVKDSPSHKALVDFPAWMFGGSADFLGKQAERTGIPGLEYVARAVPEAVMAGMGVKAALPVKSAQGVPLAGFKPLPKEAVPTTDQLRKATNEAYESAKDAGVMVSSDSYGKALTSVREMVTKEGIDPTLHPKTTAVMKRLEGATGKPLTLQEAETLRKIALDAEDDLNPVTRAPTPDARLAGKVVDELDERIDALSINDEARAINRRKKNSEMVDRLIARAEIKAGAHYTQAGMEHALRQEFKQLALNDRRMRFLSAEQKEAIKRVASGGKIENTLRALGKFDPTTSGMAAFASIGTGAGLSGLTGGASMVLPLLGIAGRRGATALTKRNVDLAREALVGRGLPTAPTPRAAAPQLPAVDSLPFSMTPGVLPAKSGVLSRGIDLEPQPVANPQQLPPVPSRMTADTPPQMPRGDIEFKPPFMGNDLAGDLSLSAPSARYQGGVDFSPTDLSPYYASEMSGGLLGRGTPATPATAGKGLLDLPQVRSKREIVSDLRRLEARAKSLSAAELADSAYTAGLSQQMELLRIELAAAESRAATR